MRILHVIPGVAARYGGPSTAIWPMAAALREYERCDVEIATTDADGPTRRLARSDLPPDSGTVHLFDRRGGESLKYSRDLARWLTNHSGDYDLIHAHSQWNFPISAACKAAQRSGTPYILRPCGMLSDYTWNKSKWKKRAFWWLFERNNVRRAAGFHVTSIQERQEVLQHGVSTPVEVIPLGIGTEAWDTPAEPDWLRRQCPQSADRPIVLFLSRLHPKKGITDVLLPALARLTTDAFLAIVGGEDEHAPGYKLRVNREIEHLGLQDRVALLGSVPPAQRWAAYDGAALFVLPSHSENFGIVVAEAMARSRPVVVSTGVQFAEHVSASGGGAVVPLDVDVLAATLDAWLADPARRVAAGDAGRRYIQNNFSWRRTAEQLADLYRRIRKT